MCRARGPLSPPTMHQWMQRRSSCTGSSSGSQQINRIIGAKGREAHPPSACIRVNRRPSAFCLAFLPIALPSQRRGARAHEILSPSSSDWNIGSEGRVSAVEYTGSHPARACGTGTAPAANRHKRGRPVVMPDSVTPSVWLTGPASVAVDFAPLPPVQVRSA
jgi:hypothetical protein